MSAALESYGATQGLYRYPLIRWFLRFIFEGTAYQFIVLLLGLSLVSHIFTKCVDVALPIKIVCTELHRLSDIGKIILIRRIFKNSNKQPKTQTD